MRIHPSVRLTMLRLVPPVRATISRFHNPEGYLVGVNGAVVEYDKDVFGPDADNFNPDRCIEGDAVRMDKTIILFGAGPRTCIGKTVSPMQMLGSNADSLGVMSVLSSRTRNCECAHNTNVLCR